MTTVTKTMTLKISLGVLVAVILFLLGLIWNISGAVAENKAEHDRYNQAIMDVVVMKTDVVALRMDVATIKNDVGWIKEELKKRSVVLNDRPSVDAVGQTASDLRK